MIQQIVWICVMLVTQAIAAPNQPPPFTDCGSTSKLDSLVIVPSPCTHTLCNFEAGQTYTMHLNFTAAAAYPRVYTYMAGTMGTQTTQMITKKDACGDNSVACPIAAGESLVYTADYVFPPELNRASMVITWELKDEHANEILCFELPIEVGVHVP